MLMNILMKKIWLILALFLVIYIAFVYGQNSGIGIFINIKDTTPPKINITKFGPTSASNITLNGSYQEETNIANITVVINSTYSVRALINNVSKKWNATINLTEGWNKFYVLAYDAAGNLGNVTSSSQGASILSDTTKPVIDLTAPENMSSVANNSLITFKISDLALTNAFYTINSGTTKSFNSIYEIKVGTSEWLNGANFVIVNATDVTSNVAAKNYTFFYTNSYAVVLNSSLKVSIAELNLTNSTLINFKNSTTLQSVIDNFGADVTVAEYNKTLQLFNVTANISNAVSSMQALIQDIISANASSQDNDSKISTINAKLDEISRIKNTTISSVDVNLFNRNLTIETDNTTTSNVTNALIAAIGGLSSADKNSFEQASEILQDKTTIINKVQVLTQTFLSGRTENVTLFEKNVTINETQSGQFYINEFIDKNITGNNDLKASTDVTNRISQPLTIVTDDPVVSWTFSDSSSAVVSYSIDKSISSNNLGQSQTVITTVPSAVAGSSSSSGTSGGSSGGVAGGGGGGGGISNPVKIDFSISKANLKVLLRQGETKSETLIIKNTGDTIFDLSSILNDLGQFKISPEENEIVTRLKPGEEKEFKFVFKASESEKPDIYPKKIIFRGPSLQKEVPAVIEVDSAQPLFDVDVEVLPGSKKIFPGEEVLLEVNLFNVRGFGRVDVNVEYSIKDLKGALVATEHETIAVETQAKFTRSMLVPSDLKPGNYVALVKVVYGDSTGVSSDLFEVTAKSIRLYPLQIQDYRTIIIGGGIILVIVILFFASVRLGYFRKKAPQTKVEQISQLKGEEKAQKLQKELQAMENAVKGGFISEESYQKDKKRIEEKLKSLK